MLPLGLLLISVGIIEAEWAARDSTRELVELLAHIPDPLVVTFQPVASIALGIMALVLFALTFRAHDGYAWARTLSVGLLVAGVITAMIVAGGERASLLGRGEFLASLATGPDRDRFEALLYPTWHPWAHILGHVVFLVLTAAIGVLWCAAWVKNAEFHTWRSRATEEHPWDIALRKHAS